MSQKEEKNSKGTSKHNDNSDASADKWRKMAQDLPADDEHLLSDEHSDAVHQDDDTALDSKTARDKCHLLEKEVLLYKDQVIRAHAEIENMRRRMEQEVSKARKFGVERVLSDLVPAVDGLHRGLEGVTSGDPQVQTMRKGMELTIDMLQKTLEKNGVLPIDPKAGDTFDPTKHEAMSMQSNPDAKSNTILQVLQKGYELHGRVLRAAMVIVAA